MQGGRLFAVLPQSGGFVKGRGNGGLSAEGGGERQLLLDPRRTRRGGTAVFSSQFLVFSELPSTQGGGRAVLGSQFLVFSELPSTQGGGRAVLGSQFLVFSGLPSTQGGGRAVFSSQFLVFGELPSTQGGGRAVFGELPGTRRTTFCPRRGAEDCPFWAAVGGGGDGEHPLPAEGIFLLIRGGERGSAPAGGRGACCLYGGVGGRRPPMG